MSDLKRECPGCGSWTSDIGLAVIHGEPCPCCGLPAEAILAVDAARARNSDEKLIERSIDAEKGAAAAEKKARMADRLVRDIRDALDRYEKGEESDW